MHFQVYLPDSEAKFLDSVIKNTNLKRNEIVREAIIEWANNHINLNWESGTFDFDSITDIPDFTSYRKELHAPKEDVL